MSKIYVVMGQSGEYSDHAEWPVKAYRVQEVAEKIAFESTEKTAALIKKYTLLEPQTLRDWHTLTREEMYAYGKLRASWIAEWEKELVLIDSSAGYPQKQIDYFVLEVELVE